jgi:hypothetical protein
VFTMHMEKEVLKVGESWEGDRVVPVFVVL